jgi:hypothetical protein
LITSNNRGWGNIANGDGSAGLIPAKRRTELSGKLPSRDIPTMVDQCHDFSLSGVFGNFVRVPQQHIGQIDGLILHIRAEDNDLRRGVVECPFEAFNDCRGF